VLVVPNLFRYATKELSQDAFVCWLLAWADEGNAQANETLHHAGEAFLNALLRLHDKTPGGKVRVAVRQQVRGADIVVEVGNRIVLLIEDKVDAGTHGDQLGRYRHAVGQKYPDREVLPIFLKTGDQSDYRRVEAAGYRPFLRRELLALLRPWRERTNNAILADFTEHLERRDAEIEAYAAEPVPAWTKRRDPWIGLYQRLRREIPDFDWGYVSNPRGGFVGAWWHGKRWIDPQTGRAHDVYLQIEQGPLCFRIGFDNGEGDRARVSERYGSRLIAAGREMALAVARPVRMSLGDTMAVARVEQSVWLAEGPNELLDLEATLTVLRAAASAIDRVVEDHRSTGTPQP
jgi:hypothetical protein